MTYSVEGNSVAWLSWLTAAVLARDFILFTAIMFTAGNNSELFWLGRGREADTCSKLPGYLSSQAKITSDLVCNEVKAGIP